jgi:hypothetical protein
LERRLTENQRKRFARAFREAGPEAVEGFHRVLFNIIDERNRDRFERHEDGPGRTPGRRPGQPPGRRGPPRRAAGP